MESIETAPEEWTHQQNSIREQIIKQDMIDELNYIAGVDISFQKNDNQKGIVCLSILKWPSLEKVHDEYQEVTTNVPYISGYLAFREVEHIEKLIQKLREKHPDIVPQIILVDGNGVLHYRGCGLASHLGVKVNIPTIGVSKKLLYLDGLTNKLVKKGLEKQIKFNEQYIKKHQKDKKIPQVELSDNKFRLIGKSGNEWGIALIPKVDIINPIYVSIGHRVSLDTAVRYVEQTCLYRVPEPIRQADKLSRKLL